MNEYLQWFQSATNLLDVIIWPFCSIVIAVIFRNEFSKLISNFERIKYKDWEVSLRNEFNVLASELPKVEHDGARTGELVPTVEPRPSGNDWPYQYISEWSQIELKIQELFDSQLTDQDRTKSDPTLHHKIKALLESNKINLSTFRLINSAYAIRNIILHNSVEALEQLSISQIRDAFIALKNINEQLGGQSATRLQDEISTSDDR